MDRAVFRRITCYPRLFARSFPRRSPAGVPEASEPIRSPTGYLPAVEGCNMADDNEDRM